MFYFSRGTLPLPTIVHINGEETKVDSVNTISLNRGHVVYITIKAQFFSPRC